MLKNRTTRVATLLLALTLITCCFVGSTFAKYTSTVSSSDSVTVAKWDIKFNDNQLATDTPVFNFNIFDTINDTGNTDDETDVADGKVAPGTSGSFTFKVENDSEVTAKYTITLSENANAVPIQYSLDGTKWYDSITALNAELAEKVLAMDAVAATHTVQWRWLYNDTNDAVADDTTATDDAYEGQNNAYDTGLGIDAQTNAATVEVTAAIVVWQVD